MARKGGDVHVALLRGINVGGNKPVSMAALKELFERLGLERVRTYINSGNVVFRGAGASTSLPPRIEEAITSDLGVTCSVLLRSLDEIEALCKRIPETWVNDGAMRCEVMFLWREADMPSILERLPHDPAIEDVRYLPGAVVWRVDREHVLRSRMVKIVGTPLYRQMTGRNVNTVRKLRDLMRDTAAVSIAAARAPGGRAAPRRRGPAGR